MKKFTYRRSVLNVAVLIWLLLGAIFLVEHWEDVGTDQGEGMSTSLLWIGVAVFGVILDLLLQYFISNRKVVHIVEGVVVILAVVAIRMFLIV